MLPQRIAPRLPAESCRSSANKILSSSAAIVMQAFCSLEFLIRRMRQDTGCHVVKIKRSDAPEHESSHGRVPRVPARPRAQSSSKYKQQGMNMSALQFRFFRDGEFYDMENFTTKGSRKRTIHTTDKAQTTASLEAIVLATRWRTPEGSEISVCVRR